MTAPTPSVTQASAEAKARADAAYTGVAGIERVDGDKSDEMERLHAFVEAVNAAEGRVEVVDPDAPLVHRTYRLPAPPTLATATPEQLARFEAWLTAGEPGPGDVAVSHDPAAPLRIRTQEGWVPLSPADAALVRDLQNSTPTQASGTVLGGGEPGDVGAVPAEVTERAAYRPIDYEATAQTTRAGLDDDADTTPRYPDPLIMAETATGWRAVCALCPLTRRDIEGSFADASDPGKARAAMSAHLRREHDRSPWPGSA